ncbi:MAG: threonine/serine dehydratase [Gemmataceae bacterium]
MLQLDSICQAQHRLRGFVHRTPLTHSASLSQRLGAAAYLKLECLQKTGSFKPRGAFNKLLTMAPEERAAGVVAVSGGNHAQGVAYAAEKLGVSAVLVMPASTPRNYLDATRGYGAEVTLVSDIHAAFAEAERLRQAGRTLVHPFDDPLVAAGQGTVGLEILEDAPGVTHVYVSIGGGGLISGVAAALKAIKPGVEIIGVETEGADAMARAMAAGEPVEMPAITSIARTLGAPRVSAFTLRHVQSLVREVMVVSDAEAVAALFWLLERTKYLLEPAASCCLAAALRRKHAPDDQVVLLACGGNVAADDLCEYRRRFAPAAAT